MDLQVLPALPVVVPTIQPRPMGAITLKGAILLYPCPCLSSKPRVAPRVPQEISSSKNMIKIKWATPLVERLPEPAQQPKTSRLSLNILSISNPSVQLNLPNLHSPLPRLEVPALNHLLMCLIMPPWVVVALMRTAAVEAAALSKAVNLQTDILQPRLLNLLETTRLSNPSRRDTLLPPYRTLPPSEVSALPLRKVPLRHQMAEILSTQIILGDPP